MGRIHVATANKRPAAIHAFALLYFNVRYKAVRASATEGISESSMVLCPQLLG